MLLLEEKNLELNMRCPVKSERMCWRTYRRHDSVEIQFDIASHRIPKVLNTGGAFVNAFDDFVWSDRNLPLTNRHRRDPLPGAVLERISSEHHSDPHGKCGRVLIGPRCNAACRAQRLFLPADLASTSAQRRAARNKLYSGKMMTASNRAVNIFPL